MKSEKPLLEVLVHIQVDELHAKFISGTIIRLLLLYLSIRLIDYLRLNKFTGLDTPLRTKNLHAVLIPLTIISIGVMNNWGIFFSTEWYTLILFGISVIAVGFVEEFIFRGTIFPLLVQYFQNKRHPLIIGAMISSLSFGLIHYINLFSQPENFAGITSQVFFALSIGVFFSGLMTRTENLIIPALIHALVNFAFGAGDLSSGTEAVAALTYEEEGINWNSVIPTTLFFAFILLGGWFMLVKSNTTLFLEKLKR